MPYGWKAALPDALQAAQESKPEKNMTGLDSIFFNRGYARIAGFIFVLGSFAGYGFYKITERYPGVYVGYSVLIGLSSIVAFGYYANLLKSERKGRLAFYSALVLSFVNPVIRLVSSSVLQDTSGAELTNKAIAYYACMLLYGAAYIVFGIAQLHTKELTGKSTKPLGTMSIIFGSATLIHNMLVRRLAPLVLVSNLIVWGIFLYMLFPPTTKTTGTLDH
jgi:hypothetical protein